MLLTFLHAMATSGFEAEHASSSVADGEYVGKMEMCVNEQH